MLPVSKDTLLRVVRRRHRSPADALKVIGIDDWAWRRNHRYTSIICNLERRRVVTLLPDREPATAQAWLAAHPTIAIVARDRGGGYGEAAAKALPHAVQVADRWHFMENASRAFLDAVRKSMRQIRSAIGATRVPAKPERWAIGRSALRSGRRHRPHLAGRRHPRGDRRARRPIVGRSWSSRVRDRAPARSSRQRTAWPSL
ncbi:transposase [Bradyrhizobium japonicum]